MKIFDWVSLSFLLFATKIVQVDMASFYRNKEYEYQGGWSNVPSGTCIVSGIHHLRYSSLKNLGKQATFWVPVNYADSPIVLCAVCFRIPSQLVLRAVPGCYVLFPRTSGNAWNLGQHLLYNWINLFNWLRILCCTHTYTHKHLMRDASCICELPRGELLYDSDIAISKL
jgi:hypothetical protein